MTAVTARQQAAEAALHAAFRHLVHERSKAAGLIQRDAMTHAIDSLARLAVAADGRVWVRTLNGDLIPVGTDQATDAERAAT